MIIKDIFIVESTSPASFGRLNLQGVIFGRKIFIPKFPYHLTIHFVVLGKVPADMEICDLTLSISTNWADSFQYNVGKISIADHVRHILIDWSKLEFIIPAPSNFTLTITWNNQAWSDNWQIIQGDGPLRATVTSVPNAAILGGRTKLNPISELMNEVREKLVIVDQYITSIFLQNVLPNHAVNWNIQVITGLNTEADFQLNASQLRSKFPKLQVRQDNLIHDRFIIRDDEEIFAFGHSLKDLSRNKVSFFHRIYDQDQHDEIVQVVYESWNRAKKII
ncbi:hypothetical protein [Nostoc sp. PA-18-2419]|uniref:hypothetical protein n=1 Tax=Nostoc sp. PA-18-2419 TaxID=2575443 RepID=UPI001109A88A|nr:hypothetical protein [Nostoc sp. PA-18-2419]